MSQKCIICDKEAEGQYTCDIDVVGLGFCKKHKSKVGSLRLWLIISEELFYKMLKEERRSIWAKKKSTKKSLQKKKTK